MATGRLVIPLHHVEYYPADPYRLLGQLSSFTEQLFTNHDQCGPLKWSKPPVASNQLMSKSHSSSSVAASASSLQQSLPPNETEQPASANTVSSAAAAKMYRSVKGVVRDPKTGKGTMYPRTSIVINNKAIPCLKLICDKNGLKM